MENLNDFIKLLSKLVQNLINRRINSKKNQKSRSVKKRGERKIQNKSKEFDKSSDTKIWNTGLLSKTTEEIENYLKNKKKERSIKKKKKYQQTKSSNPKIDFDQLIKGFLMCFILSKLYHIKILN